MGKTLQACGEVKESLYWFKKLADNLLDVVPIQMFAFSTACMCNDTDTIQLLKCRIETTWPDNKELHNKVKFNRYMILNS